jgi:membrane-bound ClpP family serine protease
VLNFFFMGPGTFYNGRRKAVGIALTVGALVLTYVELNLQTVAPNLFPLMFAAVFLINTILAYDGYMEALAINKEAA